MNKSKLLGLIYTQKEYISESYEATLKSKKDGLDSLYLIQFGRLQAYIQSLKNIAYCIDDDKLYEDIINYAYKYDERIGLLIMENLE